MWSWTMTAYRIVSGSWTKLDAVWLAAAHASRQMTAIGRDMPKSLTAIALQYAIALLLRIASRLEQVPIACRIASTSYGDALMRIWPIAIAAPPALRKCRETCCPKEIQAIAKKWLVLAGVQYLPIIIVTNNMYIVFLFETFVGLRNNNIIIFYLDSNVLSGTFDITRGNSLFCQRWAQILKWNGPGNVAKEHSLAVSRVSGWKARNLCVILILISDSCTFSVKIQRLL